MLKNKHLASLLLISFITSAAIADERKSYSLYVDTIAFPLMLLSDSEVGFYGLGLGADWHLSENISIGSSLNQWGYTDELSVSRLALRGHYYFSGYKNSGFYSTLSVAHWKATETDEDCKESLSEFRFGGMAGYQVRLGSAFFTRFGIGATTRKYKTEPCTGEEMGSSALGELVVGYNF